MPPKVLHCAVCTTCKMIPNCQHGLLNNSLKQLWKSSNPNTTVLNVNATYRGNYDSRQRSHVSSSNHHQLSLPSISLPISAPLVSLDQGCRSPTSDSSLQNPGRTSYNRKLSALFLSQTTYTANNYPKFKAFSLPSFNYKLAPFSLRLHSTPPEWLSMETF